MSKIALITGATGNLGKAAVHQFVQAGYRVIATISPGKKSPRHLSDNVEYHAIDLTNESECAKLLTDIVAQYNHLDAAILTVGGFGMGSVGTTDGASLRKMFSVNFDTAYFIARPAFLQMEKQKNGGRIILIGSRPSLEPKAGKDMIAYSLSKSLLFRLAEYLNADGASKNVVTSVIVPSTIDTPENRESMPKADFSTWVTPEAIAENISFLCSDEGKVLREPVFKVYGGA